MSLTIQTQIAYPEQLNNYWQTAQDKLATEFEFRGLNWAQLLNSLLPEQQADLKKVCTISAFVADNIAIDGHYFFEQVRSENIYKQLDTQQLENNLLALIDHCSGMNQADTELPSEDQLFKALRIFRRRTQIHIIWRDLLRLAKTMDTTRMLSDMADVCITQGLNHVHAMLAEKHGQPMGKRSKNEQRLLVLGMGKLGAHELNLSSDIDLIFAYPESGMTTGNAAGRRELSNQEFFIKVGQKLIQALDNTTIDGFVFRTDMRLRPYGESGPLVMNFASIEEYYQDQGRDWERYAMVKARIVNGEESELGQELLSILRPFIYRQYVDYTAFESLRSMKAMINTEVRRRGLQTNVKLGSGGIREIEFVVQAFQLIRGGQEKELQTRELLIVLSILEGEGYLPLLACQELRQAYLFLRDAEHVIQALNDEQTQLLPSDEYQHSHQAQIRMAFAMGFATWQEFLAELDTQRERVSHHFAQIVAPVDEDQDSTDEHVDSLVEKEAWQDLWHGNFDDDNENTTINAEGHGKEEQAFLQQFPCTQSDKVIEYIEKFRNSRAVKSMQAIGRERLDTLMPLLLKKVWKGNDPVDTLERILPIITAIVRRTVYLVLLSENPPALKHLVKLCSISPWVADYIAQAPILLDELLNPQQFYSPVSKQDLTTELHLRLLRIDENDLEQQMDQLRHFANAHKLRAAANEVQGTLTLMQVSDYLTNLAEVLLDKVSQLAWQQVVAKHGYPRDAEGEEVLEPEFIVVGYGKMGGLELSYGSDLDLVFLYDTAKGKSTSGARELDNGVFYTRMGQRMIHILSTQTRAGELYDIDMRLRPSGASGMIATSLAGFEKYQQENAWTWEHQALVRARKVSGSHTVQAKFEQIRKQILTITREKPILSEEVQAMRQKMRDNLGSKNSTDVRFQLKQDAGGIVDIEFMVQYGVLAWSHQYPELMQVTDNMRLLDAFVHCGLMSSQDCQTLQETYLAYRVETHKRALQKQDLLMTQDELGQLGFDIRINNVMSLWSSWLATNADR
ncbi:MAG: bifunctional [glutamate--ammonia ligase]-adenylyl-L-tyrosine phosphorylase/[glutamate--ammonia-ligase] adenylyltransferase [Oleispira antarctica]|nr:bifunctional [glutamate--ammonia ligase]-adenylyl-L-tyrosine phosphorylase/[glutamate--ammonia-ligase] adenylyltransferase [Oleispira antarctica]